jgi:two-component system, NarL family, sensor histidine kinase DesK
MSPPRTACLHTPDGDPGWMPFVWLVYFVPFLVFPALVHASAGMWLATAAGGAAFLALYFWGYRLTGRRILWSVAGISLLAAAFAPWNLWSSTFWVFAAAFLSVAGRPAFAARCLAVLCLAIGVESWLLHLPAWYWVPALVFTLLIGGVKIHYAELRRADARLRLAHEEVERLAGVAERERIGRDLHDLLGHTLTLVALKAELAGKLAPRDAAAAGREIAEVAEIARQALGEVRSAVAGYRSADLAAELARARLLLLTAGVEPDLPATVGLPELPAETANALALALREAVTNVVRHAGATRCAVRLAAAGGKVTLEVEDDGRGGGKEGAGLAGMRERIAALGGAVLRRAEEGTRLAVSLPLPPPQRRPDDAAAQTADAVADPAAPAAGLAALR